MKSPVRPELPTASVGSSLVADRRRGQLCTVRNPSAVHLKIGEFCSDKRSHFCSVSNDNPYSESLFRTLKYRPELPVKPFEDLLQARRWVTELVHWYNDEHRHSAIGFVTPSQRHAGHDRALLKERAAVFELARQANPLRWSGNARDWSRVEQVDLNPDTVKTKDAEPLKKAA